METPLPTPQEPLSEAAFVPMPAEQRAEIKRLAESAAAALDDNGTPAVDFGRRVDAFQASISPEVALGTLAYVEHLEAALSAATSRATEAEAKVPSIELKVQAKDILHAHFGEPFFAASGENGGQGGYDADDVAGLVASLLALVNTEKEVNAWRGREYQSLAVRAESAESALAALQEREAAARPIPVDESLPVILEDRGHSFAVQVWVDGRLFIYPAFFSKSGWHEQGGSRKLKKVTHWRHFGPDHALSAPVEPTEQPAGQEGGQDA